jgi:hypothetical protein
VETVQGRMAPPVLYDLHRREVAPVHDVWSRRRLPPNRLSPGLRSLEFSHLIEIELHVIGWNHGERIDGKNKACLTTHCDCVGYPG